MPRSTASPADDCASDAATAVKDLIESKFDCVLGRHWHQELTDAIGLVLDTPIEDALDESYDEGFSDGEDSVTEGGE